MRKWLRAFWQVITFPIRLPFLLIGVVIRFVRRKINEARIFFSDEPEDSPLADTFQRAASNPTTLIEHLNDLRKHLFRALMGLVVTTVFSFTFTIQFIDFLARPVGGLSELTAVGITEPISIFMRVALLAGIAIAFPYIAFELWLFAAPGLHRRARVFSLAAIPVVFLFFLGGMTFTYFMMLPVAITFLRQIIPNIQTLITPTSVFEFNISIMFWMGIAFEFPIVIFVLAKIGIVHGSMLLRQWRLALVIISILAALITPTVDLISMSLVMIPLLLLYFLGAGLAFLARPGGIESSEQRIESRERRKENREQNANR